ncbi:MAG TPA: extracellular solute-binding protein, partial [bacterium]|nr:extracellular solute-binding protein [bacterium]
TEKPEAEKEVTIRAIMMAGGVWVNVLRKMIPDFEAETGIKVIIDEEPYMALKDKAILEMSTGTGYYDIVVLDTAWLAEFARAGYVASLDEYIEKYNTPIHGYIEAHRKANQLDGKYWALPMEIDTRALGVNMAMVKEAGLKPPPWTMEEWAEAVIKMTVDKNGLNPTQSGFDPNNVAHYGFTYTGQAGPYSALDFFPFMSGYGGDVLRQNGPEDYTVVVDSSEMIRALTLYTELHTKYGAVVPASTTYEEQQQDTAMRLGKAATGIVPSSHAACINGDAVGCEDSLVKGQVKYFPTPATPPAEARTRTGVWSTFIPKDSAHIDEAFQFSAWITTNIKAVKEYILLGGSPAWASIWNEPDIIAKYPWAPDIKSVLDASWVEPPLPEWGQIRQIYGEMVSEAITGQKSPVDAARDAADRMRSVLKDAGYPNP